jgi:hypothetical protein
MYRHSLSSENMASGLGKYEEQKKIPSKESKTNGKIKKTKNKKSSK